MGEKITRSAQGMKMFADGIATTTADIRDLEDRISYNQSQISCMHDIMENNQMHVNSEIHELQKQSEVATKCIAASCLVSAISLVLAILGLVM